MCVRLEHDKGWHHSNGSYDIGQQELEIHGGIEKECGPRRELLILEPENHRDRHTRQRIEPGRRTAKAGDPRAEFHTLH